MIVDLTQSEVVKQMDLRSFFSDPANVVPALILAKSILPRWYYKAIRKELLEMITTPEALLLK